MLERYVDSEPASHHQRAVDPLHRDRGAAQVVGTPDRRSELRSVHGDRVPRAMGIYSEQHHLRGAVHPERMAVEET